MKLIFQLQSSPIKVLLLCLYTINLLSTTVSADGDSLTCVLVETGDGDVRCINDQGIDHALEGLPPGFLQNNKADIISTVSTLTISSATTIPNNGGPFGNTIRINPGALVSFAARGGGGGNRKNFLRRELNNAPAQTVTTETAQQVLTGQSKVLIVRANFTDATYTREANKLSRDIFNVDPLVNPSLKSQYLACSNGALNFIPASADDIADGSSTGVIGAALNAPGVAQIFFSQSVAGLTRYEVQGIVDTYIANNHPLWPTTFQHIIYVLPSVGIDWSVNLDGSLDPTQQVAAYAYVGWYKSVFQWDRVPYLFVKMHEIGHNLRMYHSSRDGNEYGDNTDYLGRPAPTSAEVGKEPKMCFNALKSWHTGWYSAGHLTVDPVAGWRGNLIGIDDFINHGLLSSEKVILKVPHLTNSAEDLYILYNRAKGVTAGLLKVSTNTASLVPDPTAEPNKVVIVKGKIISDGASPTVDRLIQTEAQVSTFLSALDDTTTTQVSVPASGYISGSNGNLVIKLCSFGTDISDYATVVISDDRSPTPLFCPCTASVLGNSCGTVGGDAACCPELNIFCETSGKPVNRVCYQAAAPPAPTPPAPTPPAPTPPAPTPPAPTPPSTCTAAGVLGQSCATNGDADCCVSDGAICQTNGKRTSRVCIAA